MAQKCRSDPIRSRVLQNGARSDPDPANSDLDPDLGARIGDPVHHCEAPSIGCCPNCVNKFCQQHFNPKCKLLLQHLLLHPQTALAASSSFSVIL